MAETEDYLSRFTHQNQSEFPTTSDVIGSGNNSVHHITETQSMTQWRFTDLLAFNHINYGYLWDLNSPYQSKHHQYKNKTDTPSSTPPPESQAEPLDSKIPDPSVKSCRTALNFNLEEDQANELEEIHKKRKTENVLRNPTEAARTSKDNYSILTPHFNIGAETNRQASTVHIHQDQSQFTSLGDIHGFTKRPQARKSRKKNSAAKFVNSSFNMVYQHFSRNSTCDYLAFPWINTNVDDITKGMEQLSIHRECSLFQYKAQNTLVHYKEQNTLIPYKLHNQQMNALVLYQRDGVIVPFEGTQSRKSQLRAKVDIDVETNRVWNLLLEDINNQGIDGTDEEKTKWWEEERKVFRGRVDSFIARMRLVQGDRRFSPWKGSVVDSVVGVFLTQNVSDHMSSSAYMSLAARYPPESANEVRRDSKEEVGPSLNESEICIVEFDDDICDSNSRNFHNYDVSEEKVVSSQESQFYGANSMKVIETSCTSVDDREIDDVTSSQHSVISSQNSVESPAVPISGMMSENGLISDNGSENGSSNCSSSFIQLLKMAEKPMLLATYAPTDQAPSCQSDLLYQEEDVKYDEISQKAFKTEMYSFSSISLQMNIHLPTVSRDTLATESARASNIALDDKVTSSLPPSHHNYSSVEGHYVLKQDLAKKKTQKNPKKDSYNWENLRKQAQENGSRTRQRTAYTMDSIDWEAIRCADVNDIAYTIRERGMNNRLAEHIKEFLDRLVNDHGSIDLEWLRDVPPDKAKEYLLSIKGLGLKSVECVRLLTLHHLAFPVDTNVGRIAVRLGWVPLQPLPESLQLHLLELYPILESIQKYLWPRLCKLDQRTLYELHYHMITFGKVFCTKRLPNCNACPLRGECRHFASAFASARLSLPGLQDESIILSDQTNLKHQDPQLTINTLPLTLPMAEHNLETKSDMRNYEPIVEIPASPERETEQIQPLECDIEDAFSEDPSKIPTIKLSLEEFTQTLQAYMQSNKELQNEGMSKALVALATEAASIPIPKLKNVSRLRTEHHVYELPDTHYLLRGLDKREVDDPCPYLLAIWSPGETANSTEPPVKRCNFEEPRQLCNDKTCSYCNSQREANSQIVRGTLLVKTHIK